MAKKEYPCSFPFEQLYIVPRTRMDIRFCCYNEPVFVPDQERVFKEGVKYLEDEFNNNPALKSCREAYIKGDYAAAGCNEGCYYYNVYKMSKKGFYREDFEKDGKYKLRKWWLSVGPDCNATYRYCLEPESCFIEYNSCDARIMDVAYEFVKDGGYIMLTGGETFLPKFRFLEILDKLSKDKNVKGYFDCHTNASFLDKKAREIILRAPLHCLNVSIDTFRPDLFNYLRRGLDFNNVIGNVRSLIKERDAAGLKKPHVNILCTLLMANCDHIIEVADRAIEEGCTMSINGIFKAPNSPDFSENQGLDNLSLRKLEKVYNDIKIIEKKYPNQVSTSSILGQLEVFIEAVKTGKEHSQVVLGGTEEHFQKRVKDLKNQIKLNAKNCDIYLWGASCQGAKVFNILSDSKIKIKGFIDSDLKKSGQIFCGKKIIHFSELKDMKKKPYILITSAYVAEITKTLKAMGYIDNIDFLAADTLGS